MDWLLETYHDFQLQKPYLVFLNPSPPEEDVQRIVDAIMTVTRLVSDKQIET